MRTFFSVAMAIAVASAQQTVEDFDQNSPYMKVGHMGEGLHAAHPHTEQHDNQERRVPLNMDKRKYMDPIRSAEQASGTMDTSTKQEMLRRQKDPEFMHPEHVFHSAE